MPYGVTQPKLVKKNHATYELVKYVYDHNKQ